MIRGNSTWYIRPSFGPIIKANFQVIDTTLAKLLANTGDTAALLSLLAGSNDCVSSELEPFLKQRPYVLATVMRIQGKTERVLDLLKE